MLLVAVPGVDAACLEANRALLPSLSALGTPIHVWCKSHHCFPGAVIGRFKRWKCRDARGSLLGLRDVTQLDSSGQL